MSEFNTVGWSAPSQPNKRKIGVAFRDPVTVFSSTYKKKRRTRGDIQFTSLLNIITRSGYGTFKISPVPVFNDYVFGFR